MTSISSPGLRMAHSLPLAQAQARAWGLSISRSRGTTSIGNELPAAVDVALAKDDPARGEYAGAV